VIRIGCTYVLITGDGSTYVPVSIEEDLVTYTRNGSYVTQQTTVESWFRFLKLPNTQVILSRKVTVV